MPPVCSLVNHQPFLNAHYDTQAENTAPDLSLITQREFQPLPQQTSKGPKGGKKRKNTIL